jgi:hypothetical protein
MGRDGRCPPWSRNRSLSLSFSLSLTHSLSLSLSLSQHIISWVTIDINQPLMAARLTDCRPPAKLASGFPFLSRRSGKELD